jgi:hypothetical protein
MSQAVTTTLPIEEVTFNNVTITIASTDPAPAYAVLCQALARVEKDPLIFIVDFCSERLEWICRDCYRDSAEVVWLENARALLGYPPLDFTGVHFAQE